MTTYTTFRDIYKTHKLQKGLWLYSKDVNFGTQSLDAGNGDVHEVIPVRVGDVVLDVWINVKTACDANATVDLGYGDLVNYWGNGLHLDSTGVVKRILSTSKVWDFAGLANGQMETEEVKLTGLAYDDKVIITPSIYLEDLLITASVSQTRFDRITVQLTNMSGEYMNIGSLTLSIAVNKAPVAGMPWVVASGDSIDIKATTDAQDVNIDSGIIEVNALIVRV